MTSEILGLFISTQTVDEKLPLRNSELLQEPRQTQESKKQVTFSIFCSKSAILQICQKLLFNVLISFSKLDFYYIFHAVI